MNYLHKSCFISKFNLDNWTFVFGIAAGISWFGALMNLFLTSGELEPWAREPIIIERKSTVIITGLAKIAELNEA